MSRFIVTLCASLLAFQAGAGNGNVAEDLPDIGTPVNTTLTPNDEYQIGAMIVRGLRDAGQILEDPELTEYLQTLGSRLVSHVQNANPQRFQFFLVKDSSINAFALPGGFIGVNAGLVLATHNESELAGVLAHEIAHVTQRHIARSIQAQSRSNLVSTAAMLAAILIGATTGAGGDVMQGAVAVAQGAAAQQRLNFTRANEYEADRVGISTLAAAGFDPRGMPAFFETMGRRAGLAGSRVPEMLQSHPVTSARIAASVTGDPHRALDAVQDGFATALRRRDSFRGDGPLEAWVWRIVLNTARSNARRRTPLEDPQRPRATNGHPERDAELRAALARLPERQRTAVFLRYYADLDYAAIGAALGIADGTVAATLNAAHAALRTRLEVRT